MDVVTGVKVECADGPCGQSRYVILNPSNATVTHVVVAEADVFAQTRLVPFEYVAESSPRMIRLKCARASLEALPPFSEYRYPNPDFPSAALTPPEVWMGPLVAYWPVMLREERRYLPEGELSIRRGAQVEASDGRAGKVDGFLVEPASGHITHLVLREGHLWGRRDVVIPVSEIDRIEEDTVYLKIDRERVGALPPFQPGGAEPAARGRLASSSSESGRVSATTPDPLRSLIVDLSSGERRTREGARYTLADAGLTAVKPLSAALADPNTQVRWEAAKALQQIGDPAIAPAMVAALEDTDSGVQWIAAEALALLGRDGIVPVLKALATGSGSDALHTGAHHVLHFLTDKDLKRVTAPVMAALEGTHPEVDLSVAARRALAELEARRTPQTVARDG